VARGTVAELRDRGGRGLWRVAVQGGDEGWVRGVPGAEPVRGDGDGALLVRLADGADEQALLDAARRAGRVRAFGPVAPTLAELFREAVAPGGGA
jgi:ABC-2 type transport system ATP-binding protein